MDLTDLDITSLVVVYGPMILMLAWFAWRLERVLTRLAREMHLNSVAIIRLLEKHDPAEASALSKELYQDKGC
ncbi:MAG TPA: hypothetical protein VI855_06965 [Dehalococcoidia bacterium]|nr:hypothetical protein [Dehalococcoidia bacterium]